MQTRHQFVETNGIKLHVVTSGPENGQLLIFLHGFPEFWFGWRKQIEHFANLGYHVVVPDQRGYNLSDKPKRLSSYSLEQLSKDVIGLIDWAKAEKALLVGHDWGAAVAWWTAQEYPERIEKLGILNVPHPKVMLETLMGSVTQLARSWYIFFFQLPKLPEWMLSAAGAKKLAGSLVGTSRRGTFTKADLKEYRKAWLQPGAITGMLNWYRASIRTKSAPKKAPLIEPATLILWGERDKFLGKEMVSPSLKLCRRGEAKFFPSASHWVQHEEPTRVNELLTEFFKARS